VLFERSGAKMTKVKRVLCDENENECETKTSKWLARLGLIFLLMWFGSIGGMILYSFVGDCSWSLQQAIEWSNIVMGIAYGGCLFLSMYAIVICPISLGIASFFDTCCQRKLEKARIAEAAAQQRYESQFSEWSWIQ
jgi:hypothetical protein